MTDLSDLAKKLSRIYGTDVRICGPYLCKDGRTRIDVVNCDDGSIRKTHLLARVHLEIKLGKRLEGDETVDHIDECKSNDAEDNLQLLTLAENSSKSAKRRPVIVSDCAMCGTVFNLTRFQVDTRSSSRAGPFCSRTCSGKYGKKVQTTGIVNTRNSVNIL